MRQFFACRTFWLLFMIFVTVHLGDLADNYAVKSILAGHLHAAVGQCLGDRSKSHRLQPQHRSFFKHSKSNCISPLISTANTLWPILYLESAPNSQNSQITIVRLHMEIHLRTRPAEHIYIIARLSGSTRRKIHNSMYDGQLMSLDFTLPN